MTKFDSWLQSMTCPDEETGLFRVISSREELRSAQGLYK
jgi:hypothetical protein